MSPLSTRYPSPASGDVAEAGGGRHRRPESLADVAGPDAAGPDVAGPAVTAAGVGGSTERASFIELGFDETPRRSARHHSGAARPVTARRRTARHSAARPATTRPPLTGNHRAPGTLPIESWLLMGKKRQQMLLASLVAVGLLFLAVPADQRREGVQAVNTAAQRAVGVETTGKQAPKKDSAKPPVEAAAGNEKQAKPEPTPSRSAPKAAATSAAAAAGTVAEPNLPTDGPGKSLRVTGTDAIALTFDDGPDPVQTPKILKMLADNHLKATFCLVGEQVRKHPEIVRQINAAGHTLCNHTWNHSLTIGKDAPEKIQADLARTDAEIRKAVPDAKIPFFRAPGGNFTDRLVTVAAGDGMTSLYWQVDPRDWDHPDGETETAHIDKVVSEVQKHVRPGSIILSHDFNQPDTIAAYEKLLPWLTSKFTIGMPQIPDPAPGSAPATPAAPATTPPSASPPSASSPSASPTTPRGPAPSSPA